jgi:hypothetical protein
MARIQAGQVPDGSGDPLGGNNPSDLYWLLAGRPGNQIGYGGTSSGGTATLASTRHATKGFVYLGAAKQTAYDETHERLGINEPTPDARLHIKQSGGSNAPINYGTELPVAGSWGVIGGDAAVATLTNDGDTTLIQSGYDSAYFEKVTTATVAWPSPLPTSGVSITMVARKTNASTYTSGITLSLYKETAAAPGAIVWSVDVTEDLFTTAYQTFTYTLSAAEIIAAASVAKLHFQVLVGATGNSSRLYNVTQLYLTAPGVMETTPLQRWENTAVSVIDDLKLLSDGSSGHDLELSGNASWMNIAGDGTSGIRLTTASALARLEVGTSAGAAKDLILCGNRGTIASSVRLGTTGVYLGNVAGTSTAAPGALLDIIQAAATNLYGLKYTPGAAQTNPAIYVRYASEDTRIFGVDPSGTVSCGSTLNTVGLTGTKFQVRAPSGFNTNNICQVVRAFATGNYTAWSVGYGGGNVFGDNLAHGKGVQRMELRQGDGQTADMVVVLSTGSVSHLTIDKDMNLVIPAIHGATMFQALTTGYADKSICASDASGNASWQTLSGLGIQPLDADLTQIAALSNALGDLLYTNATPEWALLSGNTTTTKKFLRSTGAGGVATAPAWDTVVAADISDLSTGYVTLGTTQDITGQKTFKDCGPIIYGTDQAPSMAFESSLHAYSGGLVSAYLTSDRTWQLPNRTGEVALTIDIVGQVASPATSGTIAKVNLIDQTADIASTIIANNYGAGFYAVWAQMICTTARVNATSAPVLDVVWTSDGGAKTIHLCSLSTMALNQIDTKVFPLYLASGNVAWTVSGYVTAGGGGTYAVRIRCSYLGA